MTIKALYPNLRPKLLLDFANAGKLDPRITFTRAGSATYFDQFGVLRTAPAGVARFDHDPVTGQRLGLLIEAQRANLLLRSEEFDDAYWTKDGTAPNNVTILANDTTAPDGTLTADKLVERPAAAGSVAHSVFRFITPSSGAITFSCYVKAAGRTRCSLNSFEGSVPSNPVSVIFDLSTETVVSTFGLTTSASITAVGNGWYRCVASGVSAGTSASFIVRPATVAGPTYTGDGTSGIYIWGAQLEVGAFPTSYIKTVASSVTRPADTAIMTGTNFSSWYNQSEGTFYANFVRQNIPIGYVFGQDTTTSNNGYGVTKGSTGIIVVQNADGITNVTIGTSSVDVDKVAFGYSSAGLAGAFNGNAAVVSTVPPSRTPISLILGNNRGGTSNLNGHIRKLAYYDQRLTNEQLQALTL